MSCGCFHCHEEGYMKDHGTKRKKEMGNDKLKTKSRCKIEATWDETLLSSEELGGEHHKAGIAFIVIHDGVIDQSVHHTIKPKIAIVKRGYTLQFR